MKFPQIARSAAAVGSLVLAAMLWSASAAASQDMGPGRWADASDPVARQLIEQERRWGVLSCTPSNVVAEFIADDFVGTHPRGMLYNKADMAPRTAAAPEKAERDCKLISARVRFFGADVAVIYGSETAVTVGPDGKDMIRKLVWTDTALHRGGRWQVVAVQDMVAPAP